jgi:hypothetical protein
LHPNLLAISLKLKTSFQSSNNIALRASSSYLILPMRTPCSKKVFLKMVISSSELITSSHQEIGLNFVELIDLLLGLLLNNIFDNQQTREEVSKLIAINSSYPEFRV